VIDVGVTPGADAVLPAVPWHNAACCCGSNGKVSGVMLATVTPPATGPEPPPDPGTVELLDEPLTEPLGPDPPTTRVTVLDWPLPADRPSVVDVWLPDDAAFGLELNPGWTWPCVVAP